MREFNGTNGAHLKILLVRDFTLIVISGNLSESMNSVNLKYILLFSAKCKLSQVKIKFLL